MAVTKRRRVEYIAVISGILVAMLLMGSFFIKSIQNLLLDEIEESLTEVAEHSAVAVDNKMTGRLEILRSISDLEINKDSKLNLNQKIAEITQEFGNAGFVHIGISDEDGNAVLDDGRMVYIGNQVYFQRAKDGKSNISDSIVDNFGEEKNIVVFASPIYEDDRFAGVVFGTDKTEKLIDLVMDICNGENKETLILEKNGMIIANDSEKIKNNMNFFTEIYEKTNREQYEKLYDLIHSGKAGSGEYVASEIDKITGIAPIKNTNGWCILIVSPVEKVMQKANKVLLMTTAVGFALILFVILAITYFYFFNKRYMEEKYFASIAKKRLKESNSQLKVKDEFIANFSHEIRTPMNVIVGMTYFLKKTELTREQSNYIQKIEISTTLLLGIINDILDLSKMREGKLKLHKQKFTIREVVQMIDDIFSSRIHAKNLEWKIVNHIEEDMDVLGDKQRLLQIIVNIVNNAYKFTEVGSIELSVKKLSENSTDIEFLFSVKDTGIGIAQDNKRRLFLPFEQVEEAITKVYEGTGLGLSICNCFVKLMNGNIWVESELGSGSDFRFTVRLEKMKNREELDCETHSEILVKEPKPAHVLLVEDNDINAEIAGMLLAELGIQYEWAKDGQQAIEMCKNHEVDYYDLILMDIHMPKMNGYDAAQYIREKLKGSYPIVALTATLIDHELVKKGKGIDGCLLKPFSAVEFKKMVLRYIEKQ